MKLGEMLARDKRISQEQLDEAVARQGRDGGRMGTVLVEMGFIDLDSLTVYLGLELGIPIASGGTLERVKKTAVKLLEPRDAARFRCIPIVIQHRQLIAAIDDPHNVQALEELSRITSYRVIPRVAPEIRIYYYLERYYGVRRPKRFAALAESPRGSRREMPDTGLPAPPLPGLPPQPESPTPAPTPAPVLNPRAAIPAPPPTPLRAEVELEADDLVEVLEANRDATAEQAPKIEKPVPSQPVRVSKAVNPTPIDADVAIAALNKAEGRTSIAESVMAFAASTFDLAALLVVRDNMAFGWKLYGNDDAAEQIEALLMPLAMPSIFQMALHSGRVHHDHAFPSTLHDYLFRVLHCPRPPFSLVGAIMIGDRPVNLLYGHRSEPMQLSEESQDEVKRVCEAAGAAYVRLISLSKGRSSVKVEGDSAADKTKPKPEPTPTAEAKAEPEPTPTAEAKAEPEPTPTVEAKAEPEPKAETKEAAAKTKDAGAKSKKKRKKRKKKTG